MRLLFRPPRWSPRRSSCAGEDGREARWLENTHLAARCGSWLGGGGPLRGRGRRRWSVTEEAVGHVHEPVVTDDGDLAVERDAIDIIEDRIAIDLDRHRHGDRQKHDSGGRLYAGIGVTGKVVLAEQVAGHDDAADVLQWCMAVQDEPAVPVAIRY